MPKWIRINGHRLMLERIVHYDIDKDEKSVLHIDYYDGSKTVEIEITYKPIFYAEWLDSLLSIERRNDAKTTKNDH